jgi:hypothetical protein
MSGARITKTKQIIGVSAAAELRPFASRETGLTGRPKEREHSHARGGTRDRAPPGERRINNVREGSKPEGPRPGIPARDPRD